jgi:hypothetical protein
MTDYKLNKASSMKVEGSLSSFLVYYRLIDGLLPDNCQFTTGSLPTIGVHAAINWRALSRCFGSCPSLLPFKTLLLQPYEG